MPDSARTAPRFAAALFDLDGTLVDSLEDIAGAMNWALAQHGLPTHPHEAYRHFVGEGVRVLVSRASNEAPGALQAALLESYRAHYAEHLLDHTRPFPGVRALLERLVAAGTRLAVLSNKSDGYTRQLVEALFPGVPFGAVYGERPGVARKPDPSAALALAAELGVAPAACAFVGDTPVDMKTARAAGMHAVGVTWGFRGEAELRAHGAQALAQSAQELAAALL
ncbi:HAD family hydrolase [Aggregicoccus sp. 17bor-14]|uniref:HAD family hydrolase n=1 Tax=Myxococcaceae TaxID=31 RepID=UPI00129C8752|nr:MULTISPECIES: HAD family hydrolase [Myxococcaceae]MBF5046106.1 HAD family hydrolase [Simulacricoccus sp. 17bor-14]MRI91834.1 HAD family hydrolase [Aggregicoccus sp. 17bor-14]